MAFFTVVETDDFETGSFLKELWTTIWEFHEMLWRIPEEDPELPT